MFKWLKKIKKEEYFVTYENCVDSDCSVQEQVYWGTARFTPFYLLALPLGATGHSWAVVTEAVWPASLKCLLLGLSRNGVPTPDVDNCIYFGLVLKSLYN